MNTQVIIYVITALLIFFLSVSITTIFLQKKIKRTISKQCCITKTEYEKFSKQHNAINKIYALPKFSEKDTLSFVSDGTKLMQKDGFKFPKINI